jgi:hypothetical protein
MPGVEFQPWNGPPVLKLFTGLPIGVAENMLTRGFM